MLERQVELYQEAELLHRQAPPVRVVKPISQPKTLSSIIGQRKKRVNRSNPKTRVNLTNPKQENLPKRFSIQSAEKEGYLTKQGGFIRSWYVLVAFGCIHSYPKLQEEEMVCFEIKSSNVILF